MDTTNHEVGTLRSSFHGTPTEVQMLDDVKEGRPMRKFTKSGDITECCPPETRPRQNTATTSLCKVAFAKASLVWPIVEALNT